MWTNLSTKFYEDRTINVASRMLTMKNAPHPGGHEKCPTPWVHVFQTTRIIFELAQDIIGTNLLTKFHDDRTINVISRVLTMRNATPPGAMFHDARTLMWLQEC
ncbi:hypothetical protein DPMN_154416 [Dreissena polymorpha]|uniref:Uncharacterized protein n=1 Tax=Dreissena polymorpha TaxID=45954 RepID=A0A9D4FNF0_DREPO|nr:hypothetical protein DPMN_154416 [Dreissena polymorpha]